MSDDDAGPFQDRFFCGRGFFDPPRAEGDPKCRCSGCHKRIGRKEIAWRIRGEEGKHGWGWRYCERCQRSEGVTRQQAEARRVEQEREQARKREEAERSWQEFRATLYIQTVACERCGESRLIRGENFDDYLAKSRLVREEHEARCVVPDFRRMLAALPQADRHPKN